MFLSPLGGLLDEHLLRARVWRWWVNWVLLEIQRPWTTWSALTATARCESLPRWL